MPARFSGPFLPAAAADTPAASALGRVLAVLSAVLRVTCGLAGAAVAPLVRTPAMSTPLLVAVVGLLTVWSLLFAGWTLRRGVTRTMVLVDVALTAGTCLLIRRLVAAEVLPGEVSWVAILASTSVIVAQLSLPAVESVPAGLLITGAYAIGARLAGDPGEAVAHSITLLVQTASAATLAFVARRSSGLADTAFADHQRAARVAASARAARAAERRQNRELHDTVLSTLTVVGLGGVGSGSVPLRARAAADLRTLTTMTGGTRAAGSGPDGPRVALDDRLRDLLHRMPHLRVTAALEPCAVPAQVADTFIDSAGEVLTNVHRHAPEAAAMLRLARQTDTVVVEVVDDGPGFDPAAVPRHRYGLRESVCGRMATLGGRARVESAPGHGTRIRLEWPDVD